MYGQTNLLIIAENTVERQLGQEFDWRRTAEKRFYQLYVGGIGRRIGRLLGRPQKELIPLSRARQGLVLEGAHRLGNKTVPLERIQGSENKSSEFDRQFRPLKGHIRERWVGLAAAFLRGVVLPPVELIQVGGDYYVRDGHHRISVARAFGQVDIDADVTLWEMETAK